MSKKQELPEKKGGFLTIGYSWLEIEEFIATLKFFKVNLVVDVRSKPFSKFKKSFDKPYLINQLKLNDIKYEWFCSLGGQPENLDLYDDDGIVNYEKLVQSSPFISGLKRLEQFIPCNNLIILCSEQDPITCHRFLAISREMAKRGFKIVHVLPDLKFISQESLESKLVDIYFGINTQIDFLSISKVDVIDLVDENVRESYARQNKRCGKRITI